MKKPLIIISGPTAVGKTELSVALAKKINGEIISADSMQVYQEMNIGSAKITSEEMEGIPHHLIDVLNPREDFNVVTFKKMALEAMDKIYQKGKIPILVGGTGFYIQALLYDTEFAENKEDKSYRNYLENIAKEEGKEVLFDMLKKVDEKSTKIIHPNNVKRVIRALEFFNETGSPISEHNKREKEKESPYQYYYFVLNMERAILYDRIDKRVDIMIEEGLVEEVTHLKELGLTKNMVSMQGLGYKEILAFLEGEITLEEAIYLIKRDTRHFAKRQLTWHNGKKDVIWIEKNEDSLATILSCLKGDMNIYV
ncbi:tRNA dimethylallyltransferase [Aequitasia blattaphilus]|uniref:tRNA dimethylallyltransferase n=1 Tax=Aequitasia blattaphilus TaxID=2949332 RepID=A0ABT1E9M5_9FIRM|nr:tRNA (adenosine(37)-N6)-dimethylallyltransferase MiaA [Aequitasia blattaphilus]MCP1101687.1 tRNA (adenosine(37)-N6)-dimethylallyltransferase MiaA [Aequitasia blattaphilus]MCR8614327.1 tRNA (adenosine(37)-N6)-dimethylallyltransferase MiaA [Aequitasia blattaphilus]